MTTLQTLEQIAARHLDIETLETRHADRLDFHDVDRLDFHDVAVWSIEAALKAAFEAVWSIEAALKAAFEAGQQAAQKGAAA